MPYVRYQKLPNLIEKCHFLVAISNQEYLKPVQSLQILYLSLKILNKVAILMAEFMNYNLQHYKLSSIKSVYFCYLS